MVQASSGGRRRYRGFISYSQKDKAHARRLQLLLERFRVPRGVSADGVDARTRRLGRFFRDDDELGAASDLGDALRGAIADSESLIVVCSPNAAKSHWVNKEIAHFKTTGRAGKVFAVIVSGEAGALASGDPARVGEECFPPALRFQVNPDGSVSDRPDEPLGIDLRKEPGVRSTARLVSGLLDIPFDDLWRRQQRRSRQQAMLAAAAAAVVGAVGAAGYVWVNTTLSTTQQGADSAQVARIAERAERALTAAEALSDQRGAGFAKETPEQRAAQGEARWKAATLAYATALAGGTQRAEALFPRLGYAQSATFLAEEEVTAGDLVPGAGWAHVLTLDPPFAIGADGKPKRDGFLLASSDGAAVQFAGETLDHVAVSPSRRWMALPAGFEADEVAPPAGDPNRVLSEKELEEYLAADDDTTARVDIWDLDTAKVAWKVRTTLTGLERPDPAFSYKGDLLALAQPGKLELFDTATQKSAGSHAFPPDPRIDKDEFIKWIAFSRDDSRIYILLNSAWLLTFDVAAKTWLKPVKAEEGTGDGLSNTPAGARINPGPDRSHIVLEKGFTSPARVLVTASYVLNVDSGVVETRLDPQCARDAKYCTTEIEAFSSDGRFALMKDDAGTRLVDLTGANPPMPVLPAACPSAGEPDAEKPCAVAAALSPKQALLAVGGKDGDVRLVDALAGKDVKAMAKAPGRVGYLAFSPDGSRLVGAARTPTDKPEGLIWVWDTASGSALSRSGLANTTLDRAMAVDEVGRRVLQQERKGATMWQSLGPASETVAQALARLCAVRGKAGLMLDADDLAALPASAPKEADVCKWPAGPAAK